MRIIHFADLHIGVELYGRPLPEKGWSTRMQDFLDAFDAMVNFAIEDGVDAVVFAGDAYKAREPSQTHQREFARRMRRLSEAGIPTFLLVGNHDLPNAEGRAHALEIYRTLDVPAVVVGDNSWFAAKGLQPMVLQTKSGPLQVAFLPWPQVSRWLANNPDKASLSIEQVHRVLEREMTEAIERQAAALDPGLPAVLACHVSLNDFLVRDNPGSEQWMTVGTAPTLLKSALAEEHFDYIALGHHHNNMDLQMRTPCWYSGSMQPVDFGEEEQPKGFMVFDIDPAKPRGARVGGSGLPRLEKVPARRFVTVSVRPKENDPTPEICAAIENAEVKDAIVRVEVRLGLPKSKDDEGDTALAELQHRHLRLPEARRLLEPAHFLAGISVTRPQSRRIQVPEGWDAERMKKLTPREALDIHLTSKKVGDERKAKLLTAFDEIRDEREDSVA